LLKIFRFFFSAC